VSSEALNAFSEMLKQTAEIANQNKQFALALLISSILENFSDAAAADTRDAELAALKAELAHEKKLSTAISNDCNACANQRNTERFGRLDAEAENESLRAKAEAYDKAMAQKVIYSYFSIVMQDWIICTEATHKGFIEETNYETRALIIRPEAL